MNLEQTVAWLREHDDYILTTHEGPDADGLGSLYALAKALWELGKRAVPLVSGRVPSKFAFMDPDLMIRGLSRREDLEEVAGTMLVVLDTHDPHYLGTISDLLLDSMATVLYIDHHEPRNSPPEPSWIDPTASSTCEMVHEIVTVLGANLPLDAAEALFTGIVYDTGSFIYSKTSTRTFRAGLDLVGRGVLPYVVHGKMYESSSVGALVLQKLALASLELHAGNRIAVQTMTRTDLERSGAQYEDAEDLINIPLQGKTVEVSVFLKQNLEGILRCSLRSKGSVNVAHIAQSFGGGGHRMAAGFKATLPLEQMKRKVLERVLEALERV